MSLDFTRRRTARVAAYAYAYGLALAAAVVAAPTRLHAQHQHPSTAADTARRDSTRAGGITGMGAMAPHDTGDHAAASHDMGDMMDGPLGVSHVRMGSGTSWMPDSTPMHANHKMWGDWTAMLHGVAFGQYDHQGGPRGASQFGIIDWEMLMLMRPVGTGMLHLHGMASLEPLTIGSRGYPLLLQTGESYQGQPLHDRQHPHDFAMELAAMFQQPVARNLAVELYGGLAGEPALGPVAFMHRPSAQNDPLAPLGHHWQDATHISYGVLTAGVYSRVWKLEGSWFNGREPDENRWDLDLGKLDSYSGRLTVNPTGRLSFAGWYGYLPSPEALHPDESVHRYGASALYGGRGIAGGAWSSMLLWGANEHGGFSQNSVAAETNLEIGQRQALFGRAEYVRKSAEDLVLPGVDPTRQFDVGSLVGGYMREIASIPGGSIGVGGRVSVNFVPTELQAYYGSRTPAGISVYVRVRPKRMASEGAMPMAQGAMPGMEPSGHQMPMSKPQDAHPSMPGMPGMKMSPDSSRGIPDDSGMARMKRDSAMTPMRMPMDSAMHMSHDSSMRHMPTSSGLKVTKEGNDSHRTKGTTAVKRSSRASAKASTKASTKISTKARPKLTSKPMPKTPSPAHQGHPMPGMQMPGMKMSGDSTHPVKP